MGVRKNSLYLKIVRITSDYLGLAAERFIDRQIQNHLQIEPKEITANELKTLISWIRVAVSLLTEDLTIVDDYCNQLEELANNYKSRTD